MELKWEKRSEGTIALVGMYKGKERTLGWVMPKLIPKPWMVHDDETVEWHEVGIAGTLYGGVLPCEEVQYVTLRKAMRALKETVTVLLIGRSYGT
jgi:hypothetical protein